VFDFKTDADVQWINKILKISYPQKSESIFQDEEIYYCYVSKILPKIVDMILQDQKFDESERKLALSLNLEEMLMLIIADSAVGPFMFREANRLI